MALQTLERPALSVVGMHIETRPLSPEIPALWPKFVARIDEIASIQEPRVSYGVMWQTGGMSSPASTTTTRALRSSASFSATIAAEMPEPIMQTSVSMTRALMVPSRHPTPVARRSRVEAARAAS